MDYQRFSRAIALRDDGENAAALRELEELTALESNDTDKGILLLNQANCLWRIGRLEDARRRLREAERSGSTPFTEFLDACICVTERKSEEAIQKLRGFLTRHAALKQSEHYRVYFDAADELGVLLFNHGRFADAIGPLEQALTITEGDHRKTLCFYLGVCYFKAERWDSAEERLIQSLPDDHLDPWWLQAQYYLGLCHCANRRWDAAEYSLSQCLPTDRSEPLWALAQQQVGIVYFHRGAYVKAKMAFEVSELFLDDAELRANSERWLAAIRSKLDLPEQPRF